MRFSFFSLVLLGMFSLAGCKKEAVTEYDCAAITPTYTNDIVEIMENSCAIINCHNFGSAQGGVTLGDYQGVKNAAANDRLLGAVQHKSGYRKMPQGGDQLPDSLIERLSCWVQNGMPQ